MTNLLDTIKSITNNQVSPKPVKSKPVSINERQEVWLNDKRLKWPKKKVIKEAEHDSYKLVIISHDDPLDPNETAPMIRKNAKRLGIEVHLCELMGAYLEDGPGKDKLLYSYPVDDEGKAQLPTMKKQSEYAKPITINPDNTIIMMRGLNAKDGCASWWVMGRTLEYAGFELINSVDCNRMCNDKWYNQIMFQRHNINTPKTFLIRHSEGAKQTAAKLNNKYPMILKTAIGSQGVGVMFVESERALVGIVQLLYREDQYVDILLQEYLPNTYDVRAIVCKGTVMGAMKRPVVKGDFRSNVSQGSQPSIIKLTDMEKAECLKAAESVDGSLVGVDFIPAANRQTDRPFFIEVNATPGLTGVEGAVKKNNGNNSIIDDILNNMKNILSKLAV
jgi:RimK family alpha-L-glutamate ligase